jgi:hypothetical protein
MHNSKKPIIILCPACGAKNRIESHSDRLQPICGYCGATLPEILISPERPRAKKTSNFNIVFNIILCLACVSVVYGMVITPSKLKKDFSELIAEEQEKTELYRQDQEENIIEIEKQLKQDAGQIDPVALRRHATDYYKRILQGRKLYNESYALTIREKALLRMRALASDTTKSYHEVIKNVAQETSPKGADIQVQESSRGLALQIDFDMSSVTSGEHGTRTKHHTKKSLKKEVISLISRVTNDLFIFCKNLDLETIHVGCRHYVQTKYPSGIRKDENMILYKILIRKNRIATLSDNPFLDIYSTTQYFEIEEDNFENIEIVITQQ